MNRLRGKVAVITGGSSGMGFATAEQFVREGAYVYVTGRREKELNAAVAKIGNNIAAVRGDVSNLEDLDRLYAKIAKEKGRVDVVFANAGIGNQMAPLGSITEEQIDRTFNVNVRGLIFTVQKALPLMHEGASIILNASSSTIKGIGSLSVYSASKAAVRSLARSWTTDLKGRGIRVNTISPGYTETSIFETLDWTKEQFEEVKAGITRTIPLGRRAHSAEIAKAAVFLASDESSYVAGIELFVDGGAVASNEGRVAIVTGASHGIGSSVAKRLASEGFTVIVNYSGGAADAQGVVDEIRAAGGHAEAIRADVSAPAQVAEMFDQATTLFGGVDVLVNNAGVMQSGFVPRADADDALFDKIVNTNLKGTFNTLRVAAKKLRQGGRIVNLSSSITKRAVPGYSVYAAAKSAVETMTSVFAKELRGRSITVNAVAPGPTATNLFLTGKTQEEIDQLAKIPPMERLGKPEDIAAVVAFLAGPDGGWVDGQTLHANGGIA